MAKLRNDESNLISIDYHRNGICGVGFHVAVFEWKDPDCAEPRRMVATVFPEPGCIAVLDLRETLTGNVKFACGNSWRGDIFEPTVRAWIEKSQAAA